MGAKKKGGLANRLARMSDEDRAKYLQRKADVEEEARRRKEQLVATFMKNKLRREEAFSRLNIAKINQYWHQIMRAEKCDTMKRDVEHLKRWIHRVVCLKDKTINKLMEELDWQEGLYGKNFDAHSKHIDEIIDFHSKHLTELAKQYKHDKKVLLYVGSTERQLFEDNANNEIDYLKTIRFGQELEAQTSQKENHEIYLKFIDEVLSENRTELSHLQKEREKIICALWRQISKILIGHVHQTDIRRSHLAELQRLDAEGKEEISRNDEQIALEKHQLSKLQSDHEDLIKAQEESIKHLQGNVQSTTKRFFKLRKNLQNEIALDEKQLNLLTDVSTKTIEGFEKIAQKGHRLLQLAETSKKLETEEEKNKKWIDFDEAALKLVPLHESTSKAVIQGVKSTIYTPKARPKTSVPKLPKKTRHLQSRQEITTSFSRREGNKVFQISTRLVKTVTVEDKSLEIAKKELNEKPTKTDLISKYKLAKFKSSSQFWRSESESKGDFEPLDKLDGVWCSYNKVAIDCMALKSAKKKLLQENVDLKNNIKSILAATALGESISSVKSSRTSTSKRTSLSVPLPKCSIIEIA